MTIGLLLLGNVVVALLAGSARAAQQGPAGAWTGIWERDGSTLAVEMTFSSTVSGYEGSFSSPQLRVVGIPFVPVRYEAPALLCEIVGDATTTTFEGILQGDTLVGRLREGAASGTSP